VVQELEWREDGLGAEVAAGGGHMPQAERDEATN